MKRPASRPPQYSADESGLIKFKETSMQYIETAAELSVSGWVSALSISRMTLSNYRKRGAEWLEAIRSAEEVIKQNRRSKS